MAQNDHPKLPGTLLGHNKLGPFFWSLTPVASPQGTTVSGVHEVRSSTGGDGHWRAGPCCDGEGQSHVVALLVGPGWTRLYFVSPGVFTSPTRLFMTCLFLLGYLPSKIPRIVTAMCGDGWNNWWGNNPGARLHFFTSMGKNIVKQNPQAHGIVSSMACMGRWLSKTGCLYQSTISIYWLFMILHDFMIHHIHYRHLL